MDGSAGIESVVVAGGDKTGWGVFRGINVSGYIGGRQRGGR